MLICMYYSKNCIEHFLTCVLQGRMKVNFDVLKMPFVCIFKYQIFFVLYQ